MQFTFRSVPSRPVFFLSSKFVIFSFSYNEMCLLAHTGSRAASKRRKHIYLHHILKFFEQMLLKLSFFFLENIHCFFCRIVHWRSKQRVLGSLVFSKTKKSIFDLSHRTQHSHYIVLGSVRDLRVCAIIANSFLIFIAFSFHNNSIKHQRIRNLLWIKLELNMTISNECLHLNGSQKRNSQFISKFEKDKTIQRLWWDSIDLLLIWISIET